MAEIDLRDLLSEEEELPRLSRGRASEDYDILIDAMRSGKVHALQNVDEANRAKLSQKVRAAAQRAGFKVTVRYSKQSQKIYFQRTDVPQEPEPTADSETEKPANTSKRSK